MTCENNDSFKMIFVIGLMSGTSLDGLDICYAQFWEENNQLKFTIIIAETFQYNEYWFEILQNAKDKDQEFLQKLDIEYGNFLGEITQQFIERHQIKNLDCIASHGHTIHHQPEKKYTLQIGSGEKIKEKTNICVINDFRTQDVLLGGQGAPLVPIGDELLFSDFDACLNLGGFSNISFKKNNQRIAFDICPVNIVLNYLAQLLGKKMDKNGKIAQNANINPEILQQLNALSFYQQNPPKSLGIEWTQKYVFPLLKNDSTENLIATFTEHIAQQITTILNENQLKNVLISGGGAYNVFLIELCKNYTKSELIIPEKSIIEYKEALIFALLGYLKLQNKINVLASVTGATHNHSSGKIWN